MYCGDETGAVIGDCGYSVCRFGYGGEDVPKVVLPSHVGSDGSVGYGGLARRRDDLDLVPIFRPPLQECISPPDAPKSTEDARVMTDGEEYVSCDATVHSFDAWEKTWDKAFKELRVTDNAKWTSPSAVAAAAASSSTASKLNPTLMNDGACPHPVCAVEAGHTCYGRSDKVHQDANSADFGRKQREKMLEILFEKFQAPAVFIVPSPAASAFSVGRQTGLVVDVGGGGCRATPVVDGLLLKAAQRRNGRGGEWLSDCQYRIITQTQNPRTYALHPRYAVKHASNNVTVTYPPNTTATFHRMAVRQLMYEIKTGFHVRTPSFHSDDEDEQPTPTQDANKKRKDAAKSSNHPTSPSPSTQKRPRTNNDAAASPSSQSATAMDQNEQEEEEDSDSSDEEKKYELPDGTIVDLTKLSQLRTLPDMLFTEIDSSVATYDRQHGSKTKIRPRAGTFITGSSDLTRMLTTLPLHKMAHESLSQTDIDVRKELCGNIILCGAASLSKGMEPRVSAEMTNICPSSYKCRVIAAKPIERQFSSWIGASVLTSLGSFQQLWLSKTEYEEYGVTLGCQRFP